MLVLITVTPNFATLRSRRRDSNTLWFRYVCGKDLCYSEVPFRYFRLPRQLNNLSLWIWCTGLCGIGCIGSSEP